MKFSGQVQKEHMQGRVSQIFYLCPTLNFIKCRKYCMKKTQLNLPVFCHKIRTFPAFRPSAHVLEISFIFIEYQVSFVSRKK